MEKKEGEARELVRAIQQARKDAGTKLDDLVVVELPDWPQEYEQYIKDKVSAKQLIKGEQLRIVT